MHKFYSRIYLNGNHCHLCVRKRENRIRGSILTPRIVDLMSLPRTHLYFLAYLLLSFGVSLGGLKVSPGCTSYPNFLSMAHFAAEVSSCRAAFEHCSAGMCGLLPRSRFCAQNLIPQLSPQPNTDVPLGCALPGTKLLPYQKDARVQVDTGARDSPNLILEMSTACTFPCRYMRQFSGTVRVMPTTTPTLLGVLWGLSCPSVMLLNQNQM